MCIRIQIKTKTKTFRSFSSWTMFKEENGIDGDNSWYDVNVDIGSVEIVWVVFGFVVLSTALLFCYINRRS